MEKEYEVSIVPTKKGWKFKEEKLKRLRMTEHKCKKCKAILYNGRVAREHLRKEHGVKKNFKSYYEEVNQLNPILKVRSRFMKKMFNK